MRPTQDLAVLCRRQEVIRFFTSPQNSDVLSTLQSLLRNIRSIPVTTVANYLLLFTSVTIYLTSWYVTTWTLTLYPLPTVILQYVCMCVLDSATQDVALSYQADWLAESLQGRCNGSTMHIFHVTSSLKCVQYVVFVCVVCQTVSSAVCIWNMVRNLPQSIQLFRDISQGFSDDLNYISSIISRVVSSSVAVVPADELPDLYSLIPSLISNIGGFWNQCGWEPLLCQAQRGPCNRWEYAQGSVSLICVFLSSWTLIYTISLCQKRGRWWGCLTSWQMLPEESWNIWMPESPPAASSTSLWSNI